VALAIVSALLIVAVLLTTGAGDLPTGFGVSGDAGIRPAGHNPNIPISGAGSAYDGGAYVQYLLAEPAQLAGAGSAYDGSAYIQYLLAAPAAEPAQLIVTSPSVPISGTGSAYDGGN
jgi:hypothetical protein